MGVLSWLGLLNAKAAKAFGVNLGALFEHTPRLSLPFKLEKGYVLTTDFEAGGNLNKAYDYAVYLEFLNKSGSQTDWRRLADLLDYGTKTDDNNIPIFIGSGPTISLKLSIFFQDHERERTVFEQTFSRLYPSGGNNFFIGAPLASVTLSPGMYLVRLEVLEIPKKIIGLPVNFVMRVMGK